MTSEDGAVGLVAADLIMNVNLGTERAHAC